MAGSPGDAAPPGAHCAFPAGSRGSMAMTRWNVVAAVGLERNTDGQTRYAIEAAAALPANLTVLYVGPDRIFARRMFHAGGSSCEALLEKNPAQSIVRYAQAVEADLILLTDDHFG